MLVDIFALGLSHGGALAVPVVLATITWRTSTGPHGLRLSRIAAWTTLLVALPLAMVATYLTVTPICLS